MSARLYRRSLAGLLLLLPLALWTASGEEFLDYRSKQAVVETVAAPGGAQDYGGSHWRVDSVQTFSGELPPVPGVKRLDVQATPLPEGLRLLRVRIALRPGDAEAVKQLQRCDLELADRRGRRWTARTVQPDLRREVPSRCSGSFNNSPQVAAEFRFEQDFLLPADAAGEVDAVIRLAVEKPRLLHLQLH